MDMDMDIHILIARLTIPRPTDCEYPPFHLISFVDRSLLGIFSTAQRGGWTFISWIGYFIYCI